MLVPASIYGHYPLAKRRLNRAIRTMQRGATFAEAIGAHDLIDTREHPGLFIMNFPDRAFAGAAHYLVIWPLATIRGAITDGWLPREVEDDVFTTCIQSAWGILLLLPSVPGFTKPRHRWVPFLRAAARFWPELEGEGARYAYFGTLAPEFLRNEPTSVDQVLAHSGIYVPQGPKKPFPPNWPELVEAYARRVQN